MNIGLIHCDGKLPNLALMRLSTHFKELGHSVSLFRIPKEIPWLQMDEIYGSSIFGFSAEKRERFNGMPNVHWGGTGVDKTSSLNSVAIRDWDMVAPDYSLYPDYHYSLGFTQRGCRLSCKFCVVPIKEGKPKAVGSIENIWRGKPWPKKIVLLDNDFFGQPQDAWEARINELIAGKFRVSFCQGINIRQITPESAAAIAKVQYRDNEFSCRRLYTAWDNLGDEKVFKQGVAIMQDAGIPTKHLMVYMLIGFKNGETFDEIYYRFNEMVKLGCLPYPMVFDHSRKDLKAFQRWVITGLYRACSWQDYRDPRKIA